MTRHERAQPSAEHLKRRVLMIILALSWVSAGTAWALVEFHNKSSFVLRVVFGLNLVFHPAMFVIAWRRLLSLRFVEMSCLLFASGICAACMALRLYSPRHGASIDLQPLYLWIPIIYVFAFTLPNHRTSLNLSLAILAIFVSISLPYLVHGLHQPHGNFTVQMLMVSGVLIAALYFFSSHLHRLRIAQFTVDELAHLANTDTLTKLANRRRMIEVIEHEMVRFARYGHAFSIILFDIDHFKTVNDRFGHGVGDGTLVALAARTMEVVRDADTFGRWGGEEFVVVLPETGYEETLRKAAALCAHVAAAPLMGEHAVTISCGVTAVAPGDTTDTLLQRADLALYDAKRRGRNRAEGVLARQAEPLLATT